MFESPNIPHEGGFVKGPSRFAWGVGGEMGGPGPGEADEHGGIEAENEQVGAKAVGHGGAGVQTFRFA